VRNRYFDMLRALAIIRVVAYHATGWAFLTIVFPAMGVMFALSGSFMAASLDRYGAWAVPRRARRLLPPLWTVAVLLVPAMVCGGLAPGWKLVLWLLPLSDPPASGWGAAAFGVVWYLREYLWFVLISPIALPAFRRWPLATLSVPFGLLVAIQAGLPAVPEVRDFAVYFGCWLLGFAHHDGYARGIPRRRLAGVAVTVSLAGAAWFLTHPGHRGFDLNDIPFGDTLWSTGFVLLLIGLGPGRLVADVVERVDRSRLGSRLVTLLNRRAVTVYLWHSAVIVGLGIVAGRLGWAMVGPFGRHGGPLGRTWWLALVAAGVALAMAAFGWVEDVAARRRPFWPPKPLRSYPRPYPRPDGRRRPGVEQWPDAGATTPLSRRRAGAARPEAGGI
jgi:peptidoglycan/LPS O-acetylase OafA/YrhL